MAKLDRTELQVVEDLLADMTRVQERRIDRLTKEMELGSVATAEEFKRKTHLRRFIRAQVAWYGTLLAKYQEMEDFSNAYANSNDHRPA